jgi:two-component system, chemotaxis family, sensor kinase CheA
VPVQGGDLQDTIDTTILLEEFLEDAAGHLDATETALLQLERMADAGESDKAIITLLLGNLHTLKGNSGMMGFSHLQQFLHKLESVFKLVADEVLPLTAAMFEAFFSMVNVLRESLEKLMVNSADHLDFSDELMILECFAAGETKARGELSISEKKADFSYITKKSNTLKVNFEKLDELLNLVGELVIHRTALHSVESRLRESITDKALLEAFNESSQLIGKTAADLREAIMKVRMLPVSTVFQRFKKLVRDLSLRHDKEINLTFAGEETELDKTVIDEIGEPLLHLIRNAVDHGIETPRERIESGKPPAGSLRLTARHESNFIVISVEDDGRGISPAALKKSALVKGLITTEQERSLTDQEVLELIFLPGFSTSGEVTETSGRGIGLDVVKKTVSSLGGTIEISSSIGAGTVFTIKLPLTLAIISALLVDVSGETFAIPLSGVLESIKINSGDIHDIGGAEMIKLRDQLIPISRLNSRFGIGGPLERESEYVVIVGSGERKGGVIVDRLIGQQEIVIKALDDYLGELAGIAGGTIMGDGRISLILDIDSFVGSRMAGRT